MTSKRSIVAQFVVEWGLSYVTSRREHSLSQHFAGNAELHPASRAPGMDMRAGDPFVMHIPWGVAP